MSLRDEILSLNFAALNVIQCREMLTIDAFTRSLVPHLPSGLAYLARGAQARRSFEALLPGTRSVICAAVQLPPAIDGWARFVAIGDYHAVLRNKLLALEQRMRERQLISGASRVCVDSAPILERELAVRAGFGWIASNRMLVHPKFGASLVLGELLITDELQHIGELKLNAASFDPAELVPGARCVCSKSRLCVQNCPTGALSTNAYEPAKCLAYLTTQQTGELEETFAESMGNVVWGCDRCQMMCPVARFEGQNSDTRLAHLTPELILSSSAKQLTKHLSGTPMSDAHPRILQRNVCYVLGNTRDFNRAKLLSDVSQNNPCDWVKKAALRSLDKLRAFRL